MKFREGFIQITNSKSRTFLVFCFCFLVGITYASLTEKFISLWYMASSLLILIASGIIWRNSKRIRFIIFATTCFVIGLVRYQMSFPPNTQEFIHSYVGNKIEITGFVSAEPDIRLDGVRYRVRTEKIVDMNQRVQGEVYIKNDLYPRYRYGEELRIVCTMEKPEPIEDVENGTTFRYDRYLSRMDVYALCAGPKIEPTGEWRGNLFYTTIFSFKSELADVISHLWHEPYASFVAGLLYGYRGGLGSLNELFAITGVTHIVAISGYNITIIATIFISLAKILYIPRKKAFWVVVTGIILFVIFAGASASVIRAGIMGIIVLIARQTGRTSSIGNVLVLTAVIMSLQNPFVLVWDAGFQLSFLATMGLVYLSPLVSVWFERVPELGGIKESLVSTLSAIISTLPLILFQFGRLSIVAPLVNILILWIIPWIMIAGAIAVLIGFIATSVGRMVGIVAYGGMEYIVRIVEFFAHIPYASISIRIPWFVMIISYILLGICIKKYKKSILQ